MKRYLIPGLCLLLVALLGCKKEEQPTTQNPSGSGSGSSSQKVVVNGNTYNITSSTYLYFIDNSDESYYSGGNNGFTFIFQLGYVDPDYISDMVPDGGSETFSFDYGSNITVLPSPSYGKCFLEIVEPSTEWENKDTGTLTVSRSGNKYTFSCTNIEMQEIGNASNTTTASVNYSLVIL